MACPAYGLERARLEDWVTARISKEKTCNRELSSVLCDDLDEWDWGGERSKREGIYVYI